jgi:hypothetical protein
LSIGTSKGAERVRLPDHRIGARVFGRDRGEIELHALMLFEQVETALHTGEHAERQHVDLHHVQRIDIILVPLDHLAVLHRGGFDRHQIIKAVVGKHIERDALCVNRFWVPAQMMV